jgi:hypothetical protein
MSRAVKVLGPLPQGLGRADPGRTPIKGWPAGDYVGMTCAACHRVDQPAAKAFRFFY